MNLRRLEQKDAPNMLEWMHDNDVVKYMNNDFASFTIESCLGFIEASYHDDENVHLAIVNSEDEYMGTVSLKHFKHHSAEFAIAIRSVAMGKGFSQYAMKEIIKVGFDFYCLNSIYWCVNPNNNRAIKFYKNNGYRAIPVEKLTVDTVYSDKQIRDFLWFQIFE